MTRTSVFTSSCRSFFPFIEGDARTLAPVVVVTPSSAELTGAGAVTGVAIVGATVACAARNLSDVFSVIGGADAIVAGLSFTAD